MIYDRSVAFDTISYVCVCVISRAINLLRWRVVVQSHTHSLHKLMRQSAKHIVLRTHCQLYTHSTLRIRRRKEEKNPLLTPHRRELLAFICNANGLKIEQRCYIVWLKSNTFHPIEKKLQLNSHFQISYKSISHRKLLSIEDFHLRT